MGSAGYLDNLERIGGPCRIAVVGQHGNDNRAVFLRGCRVVRGDRSHVGDRDRERVAGRRPVVVRHRQRHRVAAVVGIHVRGRQRFAGRGPVAEVPGDRVRVRRSRVRERAGEAHRGPLVGRLIHTGVHHRSHVADRDGQRIAGRRPVVVRHRQRHRVAAVVGIHVRGRQRPGCRVPVAKVPGNRVRVRRSRVRERAGEAHRSPLVGRLVLPGVHHRRHVVDLDGKRHRGVRSRRAIVRNPHHHGNNRGSVDRSPGKDSVRVDCRTSRGQVQAISQVIWWKIGVECRYIQTQRASLIDYLGRHSHDLRG